ncbi:Tripartite tricarboxylate transporter TctB family [Sphaerochaeta pleomorpha str. Grapes]|uniref:Tripartite tricarboxylate transporter TctB family n=1 Tax=Sphaerochaeta pleomorpha (strain ATCC BAA-1885 / DSM 22778 / Grapes) TaxID=158190 RepID=G8QQF0_SPHPG|nr:tripartite tricarboxylate transporter TctB family protein [Sphaerochaeta pleomorpha]AEV29795.1 Tripartite tricarboxylate transporter TctB family [Sphaerochaeta pleomorpha str. Grapes]
MERKKFKVPANRIIPVFTALVAIVFMYYGLTKYGFWDAMKGPRPGFVPTLISVLLLALSLISFISSFKEEAPVFPMDGWLCALGMVSIIVSTFIIGLVPSVALYMVLWLRVFEKSSWKTTLIALVVIMAIVIGVFSLWLGIDFPKGIILDAIFR